MKYYIFDRTCKAYVEKINMSVGLTETELCDKIEEAKIFNLSYARQIKRLLDNSCDYIIKIKDN